MDTMYAWLQQHPQEPLRSPSAVDSAWKDSSSTPTGTNGASTSAHSPLDLSEFGLGDIASAINNHGPSPSSSSSTSVSAPSQSYPAYQQYGYYIPGPYNATAYGSSTQWNSGVPLSSYSSLNGATTSNGQSSHSPPSSQQMIIDPALTMNGSGTPQQQYNTPSNLQQRTQYQYLHNLSINPAYVQGYPQPQSSVSGQQPQTMSPYALHTSPPVETLNPSVFYTTTPTPQPSGPQLTPQVRQEKFHTLIRPLLQPNQFTGAGAVLDLTDRVIALGMVEMEANLRLEVLTKIRDNAGNHYFRAWVENEEAMEITREWLKAAAKGDDQLAETIMPLLHIIDRLPWSLESLRKAKLGKIVLKLTKEASIPAIKDMASNLERKWRQMLPPSKDESSKKGDGEITEEGKTKKRKLSEPPSKTGPPAKKPAIASTSSARPATIVKKETKPSITAVKDAKSDSSFFSAPKPKPKLPSFKKAPTPVKKEADVNVAQPSSVDPFQEALKSMGKARKETTVASPFQASTPPTATSSVITKAGKKRKSVSWAPESQLEQIKFIERAIYDDDPVDGAIFFAHNIRDLDRDEGAALHAHLFEELIDWSEPLTINIPPDSAAPERGGKSEEQIVQVEREKTALEALYMSAAQIPDTPAEPSHQIPEDQVDVNVRPMITGPDVDSVFWGPQPPLPGGVVPQASVSDLVQQLGVGSQNPLTSEDPSKAFNMDPSLLAALPGFGNITAEQLSQVIASLSNQNGFLAQPGAGQSMPSYGTPGEQNWNMNQYGGGEYGYDENDPNRYSSETGWDVRGGSRGSRRGRGGSGGRGGPVGGAIMSEGYKDSRKRKPCTFFAQGRCRYGDQCDFSHEPVY